MLKSMDTGLVADLRFAPLALVAIVILFPAPFVFNLYSSGDFSSMALGALFHLGLLLAFVRDLFLPATKLALWFCRRQA